MSRLFCPRMNVSLWQLIDIMVVNLFAVVCHVFHLSLSLVFISLVDLVKHMFPSCSRESKSIRIWLVLLLQLSFKNGWCRLAHTGETQCYTWKNLVAALDLYACENPKGLLLRGDQGNNFF